jgi:hypothetical protein
LENNETFQWDADTEDDGRFFEEDVGWPIPLAHGKSAGGFFPPGRSLPRIQAAANSRFDKKTQFFLKKIWKIHDLTAYI